MSRRIAASEHEPEPRAERCFSAIAWAREAVVFLARVSGGAVGEGAPCGRFHVALSAIRIGVTAPVWLLNDLYVEPWARAADVR